jgi:hypothetical protein
LTKRGNGPVAQLELLGISRSPMTTRKAVSVGARLGNLALSNQARSETGEANVDLIGRDSQRSAVQRESVLNSRKRVSSRIAR